MTTRFPAEFAAGLVVLALAVGLASCQSTEEDTSQAATDGPSPTASPSPAPTLTASPGVSPAAIEFPAVSTPEPGFVTHTQPPTSSTDAFRFDYPKGWFLRVQAPPPGSQGLSIHIYSFDNISWGLAEQYPPETMKLSVIVTPNLSICMPADAQPAELGNAPAAQVVQVFDPPHPSGLTKAIMTYAQHGDQCYIVSGSFAQKIPDEGKFSTLARSFTFGP